MAKAVRPIRIDPDRWTEVQAQAGLEGLKTNTLVENMIEEGMEKRRGPRPEAEPKELPVVRGRGAGRAHKVPLTASNQTASAPVHAVSVGPVTPQAGSRLKGPKAEKQKKWK